MTLLIKALAVGIGTMLAPAFGKSADVVAARNAKPMSVANGTDLQAHAAATSPTNLRDDPTDGQKDAGNYRKGHVTISGLSIAIENPQGSTRYSHADVDPPWEAEIKEAHYGYLKGVVGQDKDHLDVFLKPATPADFSGNVYIVHQLDQHGAFDEHKVLLGYASHAEAVAAYQANYPDGWQVGPVEEMTLPEFKAWTAKGSVVQRWWGSGRPVAFTQPAPFLSKGGVEALEAMQDKCREEVHKLTSMPKPVEKDVTTGTGLSTPQAGLTHYDRGAKKVLREDDSDEAFQENVKTEIAAGKSQEQAVAIAYATQREAKKKKAKQ